MYMTMLNKRTFYSRAILPTIAVVIWAVTHSAAFAQAEAPTDVKLQQRGHGLMLADAKGMTLYTYTPDQDPGKSACNDQCAAVWPPLKTSPDAKAFGEWSIIARKDGSSQWAFRSQPLYTYSRDVAAGDANGDELNQQWFLAVRPIATPPGFKTFKTQHGHLLVDLKKMTLYTSDADNPDKSTCDSACARTWRPVEAWWGSATVSSDWSVVTRDDGTIQWAYKTKPLYRYTGDFNPGEIAGNGIGSWHAAILEPPPPVPGWVTYQTSDGGELIADPHGQTIYAHDFVPGRRARGPANGMARPGDWKPVLALPGAKSVGYWSAVTLENGTQQWAHKGLLLYTNVRDTEPGDLNGIRSTDRVWRPIMKTGLTMAGTGQ